MAKSNDQLRRLLVGERERVGENEPPFGVGVADFDGEPLAAAQDVAGAHRRGGDRVLDDRDQHAQADVEPRLHDQPRQRQRRGRAAHVLLHQPHAARRLDVEAAAVEGDALADQRHLRRVLAPPADVDEARRLGRGLADGVDERQIAFEEIVAARRFERRAEFLGELSRLAFERRRAEIVGGRVDEVAAERDGAGDRLEPRRVDSVGRDQPRPLGRVGAVAVEAVEAEQERQRRQLRLVRRVGEAIGAGRQRRGEAAGGERIATLGVLLGEAEQRAGEAAVGARQQLQPSRLRLEAAGGGVARRRRADRRLDRRPAFGGDEPDRNGVRIGRGELKAAKRADLGCEGRRRS